MDVSSKILQKLKSSSVTLILIVWMIGCPAYAIQEDLPKINVLADPSLSVALSELARQFAARNSISVTTAYAPSRQQRDSIMQGLEADVFITTNSRILKELQTQGLLDVYSKKIITKNRLSLATYRQNSFELILIPKLPLANVLRKLDPDFTFTIGDPTFQNSGYFALRALRNYEMAGDLEPNLLFVRSPVDVHRTINQPGGYGILYRSEATRNTQLKILGTFPEVAHSPILYQGMVVAGENMEPARQFLDYLASPEAQVIFQNQGFDSMTTFSAEKGHLAQLSPGR